MSRNEHNKKPNKPGVSRIAEFMRLWIGQTCKLVSCWNYVFYEFCDYTKYAIVSDNMQA